MVTRNGHAEARTVTTAAGGIDIEAPRVNDRRVDDETGERCRFRSAIVPPWCRKSPKVAEVLPLMQRNTLTAGVRRGTATSIPTRLDLGQCR